MNFSKRFESDLTTIFEEVSNLKSLYCSDLNLGNNSHLIDLSLGSTDLLPPRNIVEVISNEILNPESSKYSLFSSTKNFREAVASWVRAKLDVSVDPNKEILFLIGSQEGISHLPLSVINPGDHALILDPSYPCHRGGLALAKAKINKLLLRSEESWRPVYESLDRNKLDQIKIFLFGFPHNPTAQTGNQEYIDQAMKLGIEHDFIVAHDNPYFDLAIDGESPSLLNSSGWRNGGIEFFSLSKGWCLGGFRIGFAVGSESIISELKRVKSYIDFNQSNAIIKGAVEGLSNNFDFPKTILKIYKDRRDFSMKRLRSLGWDAPLPTMAMYLWMPLPLWAEEQGLDDKQFMKKIIQDTGVAITPGSGFGAGGKNWVRLALVCPEVELNSAFNRIEKCFNANS
tara:strand:- start:788 stop:1984 length:1197 start_codon:yes stop_codon:yes gene_type:complete